MIYYICGKLVFKSPARVVIENGGKGYVLNVSLETSRSVGEEGDTVKLFTLLQVRDEEVILYGFASEEEREAFNLLLGVPGIGPKVALRILSGMDISELCNAIISEDAGVFTGIPGVGKKTGERIIVELKQRVEKLPVAAGQPGTDNREIFASAVEALVVLGYKRRDAAAAVTRIMKDRAKASSIEDIIREALKKG